MKSKFIIFSLFFLLSSLSFLYFSKELMNFGVNENSEFPVAYTQGVKDNPFAASEYRYNMLTSSEQTKDADIDIYEMRLKAIEYAKQNNMAADNDNSGIGWVSIGPGNIGGRIRSMIIHPTTPTHMLVGAVAGGVWKTTNGGVSWYPAMEEDNPVSIGCMLQDATDPDIIYAGSGEGWGNGDAVYGGGIFKSTDFGGTWEKLLSTFVPTPDPFRNVLRMSQDDAGNIYAATKNRYTKHGLGDYTTSGGLYKSTNGGSFWTKISPTASATNYFNPCDVIAYTPSVILFAVNKNAATYGGIYKTTNGGTNWSLITSGLPVTGFKRIAMAQDPSHKDTVYAVLESEDFSKAGDAGIKGIYRSTNQGTDWTAVSSPPKIVSTDTMSYLGFQGWYDNVIAVDPYDSDNLFVGGVDMMKSTNYGASWSQITYWSSFFGTPVVHADHHVIAFHPSSSGTVFSGNDGGIHRSTDFGASWTELNNELFITQFYSGAVYKMGPTIHGGTQDNGHLKFTSGSDWSEVFGGDGGYSAQSQTDPMTFYEEFVNLQISKTTDGGTTWADATTGLTDAGSPAECLFIAPFSMNPVASEVLIAGSNEVWLTTNGAASWTAVGGAAAPGHHISAVTVIEGTAPYKGYMGTTDGKIYKCTTLDPAFGLGNIWFPITPPPHNGAYVRRIVTKPGDPETIIACYSGFNITPPFSAKHVWLTTTGGAFWIEASFGLPNIPVHSAVFDPIEPLTIWIGTEAGVYKTIDFGISWTLMGAGIPDYVPVDELVLQKDTDYLFAFTHGRGVFRSDVVLPVELNTFSHQVNNNNVTLNWSTSSEINNSGFDIERKVQNGDWSKIGFVKGIGNSSNTSSYSYSDNKLSSGSYTYRLKQIDFNGNFRHYELGINISIEIPDKFSLSQNYPNPFNPVTNINFSLPFDGKVNIELYDMTGRKVMSILNENVSAGNYTRSISASDLSSGVYIYRLNFSGGTNFTDSKRMVVIK